MPLSFVNKYQYIKQVSGHALEKMNGLVLSFKRNRTKRTAMIGMMKSVEFQIAQLRDHVVCIFVPEGYIYDRIS